MLVGFAELRWLISQPSELVGCYFTLLNYVKFYDKNQGLKAATDELKEYDMVIDMLETLDKYDSMLRDKLEKFLQNDGTKKSMV